MVRFFHTGDLHPSSSQTFAGKLPIDPATGRNLALSDLRKSLDDLFEVVTAPATRCDFGLVPGDAFDSSKPTMDEVQVIVEFAYRVAEEMPIVFVPGNHDMALSGNMASALEPLKMRERILVFERPDSFYLPIKRLGETVRLFMLPYPQKGRLLAQEAHKDKTPEEVTALINHGLASILRAFALDLDPAGFNILLAHGTTSTAKVGLQPRSIAHDILIPLDECQAFGYVALNHIHLRQQVAANAYYSGSLCRQDFGEEHEPKGFNLVEMEKGQPANVQFVENPHTRVYRTFQVHELQDLTPDPERIYRIKDQLTAGDYEASKGLIEAFAASVPYCQTDIEITAEDRARDAGMAQCLTVDEALVRALEGKVEAQELPAVLEKHHQLMQEVGQ